MSSVGIYMPAFNSGQYISEAIESIKKQSFTNWELIIIDDFSINNTYDVANSYADDKIKVFRRENHSGLIGKIKNECIEKFSIEHDYICHVGSDDLIPDHCLKTFVDFLDKNKKVDVAYGNFECFNDKGERWTFPHVANSGGFNPDTLLQFMCIFPMRFYRFKAIKDVGGYSNELSSAVDFDLCLKLYDSGKQFHRIKDPITYYYRQHKNQVSTKARTEQDLNAKKALESSLKRRGIKGKVANSKPPFVIIEQIDSGHFIWGKKI